MKKIKDNIKIIICCFLILALSISFILEFSYGKNNLSRKGISFSKEAELNYVTYLKNNNHYSSDFLENDYNYVANLVDYFNLDFNYSYVLSENIDYKLDYEIVGYLEIYDSDNMAKPIEKKEYNILEKVTEDKKGQVINVALHNQKINYETYSSVVQMWKKELNPNANLKVVFKVNWQGYSKELEKEISDSYTSTFEIPLSEKIISISKPSNHNETGYIYSKQSLGIVYVGLMILTGICLILVITYLIITMIKINKSKSKYEQKIKKILREFDRAITEAKGKFKIERGEKAIEVSEFMELMDVHDNLHEPIIYYKTSVNKCTFVVRNGKDIYYTIIKRDEYE